MNSGRRASAGERVKRPVLRPPGPSSGGCARFDQYAARPSAALELRGKGRRPAGAAAGAWPTHAILPSAPRSPRAPRVACQRAPTAGSCCSLQGEAGHDCRHAPLGMPLGAAGVARPCPTPVADGLALTACPAPRARQRPLPEGEAEHNGLARGAPVTPGALVKAAPQPRGQLQSSATAPPPRTRATGLTRARGHQGHESCSQEAGGEVATTRTVHARAQAQSHSHRARARRVARVAGRHPPAWAAARAAA